MRPRGCVGTSPYPREAAARREAARKNQRVQAAKQRARRAALEGATLQETTSDMMTGAERLGCGQCGPARCRQFKCVFTEKDTVDPEIMLFCSTCGCEAEAHAVCPTWWGGRDWRGSLGWRPKDG